MKHEWRRDGWIAVESHRTHRENTAALSCSPLVFLFFLLTSSCVMLSMTLPGWTGSCVLIQEPWGSCSWHISARLFSERNAPECLELGWFSRTNQTINKIASYIHTIIVLVSDTRIEICKPYGSICIQCRNTCCYQRYTWSTEKHFNDRSQELTESCFGLLRNFQ